MPTYYVLRDAHKTRGPMDAASARLLLTELGVAGVDVAEVSSGAPGQKRVFGPAAEHPLWTDRAAAGDAVAASPAAPWLTTETSGWPDAQRLGIVAAERVGRFEDAPMLRAAVLEALTADAAALGADAVVAVSLMVTDHGGDGVFVASSGTALRLG